MSDIGPIQPAATSVSRLPKGPVSVAIPASAAPRATDQVELSDRARLLSQLSAIPDVRQEMVNLAKSRIESGFYDNESVIDTTLDRVAEEISG